MCNVTSFNDVAVLPAVVRRLDLRFNAGAVDAAVAVSSCALRFDLRRFVDFCSACVADTVSSCRRYRVR